MYKFTHTDIQTDRRRDTGRDTVVSAMKQIATTIGHSGIGQGTGASMNNAFKINRDQVVDLETCFKIHTNVSNVETASPKTI